MARSIKPEAVAKKRQEILDATERFMFTKGYEQMSIQDILDEIKMSSGHQTKLADRRARAVG